jgi:hypothetical protein
MESKVLPCGDLPPATGARPARSPSIEARAVWL